PAVVLQEEAVALSSVAVEAIPVGADRATAAGGGVAPGDEGVIPAGRRALARRRAQADEEVVGTPRMHQLLEQLLPGPDGQVRTSKLCIGLARFEPPQQPPGDQAATPPLQCRQRPVEQGGQAAGRQERVRSNEVEELQLRRGEAENHPAEPIGSRTGAWAED